MASGVFADKSEVHVNELESTTFYIDSAVEGASFFEQTLNSKTIDQQVFHLFTHGQPGKLLINGKWLNSKEIATFLKEQTAPNTREIYLYGCNFAKGDVGQKALDYLAQTLQIKISASNDITGQNGDWVLENNSIDLTAVFAGYAYSLQDSDGDLINDDVDLDDDNDGILDTDEGFFSQNIATGIDAFIVTADNGTPSVTNIGETAIDATAAVRATEGIAYKCRPAIDGGWGCAPTWDKDNITFDDGWNQGATAIYVPNFDGFNEAYEDPDDGDETINGDGTAGNHDKIFSYDGDDITFSLDVTIPADLADQDFVFTGTVWADEAGFLLINGTSYPLPANSWWLDPLAFSVTISKDDINAGLNTFSIRVTDDTQLASRSGILLEGSLSTTRDTDGDGVADHRDLDADNDGITDLEEAGGTDSDGDGVVDNTTDTDNDGLVDAYDTDNSGTAIGALDTDGDGVADRLDLDSDNDGINDITEAGIADSDNNGIVDQIDGSGALTSDADGDGFTDSLDPNDNTVVGTGDGSGTPVTPADTDSDSVPDFRDLDSDNDGINDINEGGNADFDTNGDGSINAGDTGYADADSDGIPDPIDNSTSSFGDAGNTPATDTDSDNVPDFKDLDSDNDGINDVIEGGNTDINGDGQVDNPTADADGDGIPDSVDGASGFGDETGTGNDPTNTDGVDTPDYQDLDSNNDGTTDFEDNGGDPALDTTPEDGTIDNIVDADGDGIPDVVDGNTGGFGDVMTCGSGDVAYAMSDGTSNTTGYQWNGSADVASTDQFGLVRATLFCEDGTWRHYYNANEPDKFLFSIEMGANTTEIEYVEIRLQETPASLYDTMNTSAIFPMARDWFVKTVGNAALTANVNARFYFAPSELKAILDNAIALAETDGAATSPTVNDITWFKKDTYDPATDISPDGSTLAGGQGYTTLSSKLVPNANGEIEFDNGVNFVQFNGLTGFSGGSAYVMVAGAALPVTLTSFTGKANACNVNLSWASASEQDFSHYDLEWSEDGRNFTKVSTRQGAANSLTARTYSYAHTAAAKQNYYRLKQVDLDGSFEYSETIVVTTDCSSASMEVYPNPISKANDALTVNYAGSQEVVDFYIMDAMGRLVQQLTFDVTPEVNTRLEVEVTDLPTGTYFIGVTDPKVTVPAMKFMVTN